MKRFIHTLIVIFCSLIFTQCTTSFRGNANVDRKTCETKCENWEMELSGMVAMGEYSSGCICRKKSDVRASQKDFSLEDSFSASGPAVVGVVTMMREQEAAQRRAGGRR